MTMSLDFLPLGHLLRRAGWNALTQREHNPARVPEGMETRLYSLWLLESQPKLVHFIVYLYLSGWPCLLLQRDNWAFSCWIMKSQFPYRQLAVCCIYFNLLSSHRERPDTPLVQKLSSTIALPFHFLSDCPFCFVLLLSLSKAIPNSFLPDLNKLKSPAI